MADVSAHTPVFSRGSGVLEYWLVHAEGLVVEPLGARVEKVVVAAPEGKAEELIVRSRMTRRRRSIPAAAIAAVEPSRGQLLLEPPAPREQRPPRPPRPSRHWIANARKAAVHGGHAASAGTVRAGRAAGAGTARAGRAAGAGTARGTRATYTWCRPRVVRAGGATKSGAQWFAPRARRAALAFAQHTYTGALLVAHGGAVAARVLERALATAIRHGAGAVERRRHREPS